MIDLHCHILPGIDDGAGSLEESLAMAAMAADQGIRHMVATPHCITGSVREVEANVEMLRQLLQEEGIPLQLYGGMEIFGTYDTARLLKERKLMTLNGSRYPLIEFDFYTDGEEETRILASVLDAGYTPLVAHPERYGCVCYEPERINLWREMGCLFQINRGSLLGRYGRDCRQMAMELVGRGFATVVATDAHSDRVHTPRAMDVYGLLSREFSPDTAQMLMEHNPRRILKDILLPPGDPQWFE